MSVVDVAIVIAVLVGVIRGFFTGLVRQVVGLAGFIVAFVVALELMPFVASWLGPVLGVQGVAARVAAFVLVFGLIQIAAFLLGRIVEKTAKVLRLTILNRVGGGALGGLKSALIVSVLLVLLARFNIPSEPARQQSVLYGPILLAVPTVWDLAASAWPRVQTLSERFGDEVRSQLSDPEEVAPSDAAEAPSGRTE